jgi:hypothetical protein
MDTCRTGIPVGVTAVSEVILGGLCRCRSVCCSVSKVALRDSCRTGLQLKISTVHARSIRM